MPENLELQQLVDNDDDDINDNTIVKFHQHHQQQQQQQNESILVLLKQYCYCPYLGLILATLSSLFFSLCSVIVKWLTDIDPIALAAYRYLGVLLPTIPICIYRQEPLFPYGKRIILLLRSFTGTAALILSFYAFRHMPLADASVIVFSVPVFTSIFARLFLKERCSIFNIFSIILTIIGVVLITRPTILFNNTINSLGDKINDNNNNNERTTELWGIVAAFSATLFGANAYILLRALKTIHFSIIMTNFGIFALIKCLLITYFFGNLCIPSCQNYNIERYLIIGLAIFSFLGQILLTIALQIEQAGPVAIARSSDIVFAFIWQIVFFNEIPNIYSICGAILVMCSVVLIGIRKWLIALPNDNQLRQKLIILTK